MTFAMVQEAVTTLKAQGATVSQRGVLRVLGAGSKRDVARYLRQVTDGDLRLNLDEEPVHVPLLAPDPLAAAQEHLAQAEAVLAQHKTDSDAAYETVVQAGVRVLMVEAGEKMKLGVPHPSDPRNQDIQAAFDRAKRTYLRLFTQDGPRVSALVQEARLVVSELRAQARQDQQRAYVQAHQPELFAAVRKAETHARSLGHNQGVREAHLALKQAMDSAPVAIAS